MIERVLMVPLNYSHRQTGQIQAFEQIFGYQAVNSMFDFWGAHQQGFSREFINDALYYEAVTFKPDWIWMQVQTSGIVDGKTIEKIKRELPKTLITHWMGDLRTEVPDDLKAICAATDVTLLSNSGQLDMWIKAGARRVNYVQIGLDWDQDVLGQTQPVGWEPPFRVPDVVFIGGYYEHFPGHKVRLEAIRALMREGIDVGVVSESPWPSDIPVIGSCHVKNQHAVYKRAKVALSINNFNDVENYYSDRHLIAMASGTSVVCHYVPGLEDEFSDGIDCAFFHTIDGMLVRIHRLLANDELRKIVGMTGRHKVMVEHSWHRRILDLLPYAEQWRSEL